MAIHSQVHQRYTSSGRARWRDAQYVHRLVEVLIRLKDLCPLLTIYTRGSIAHDTSGELAKVFVNGTIPQYVTTFQELEHHVLHYNLTDNTTRLPPVVWDAIPSTDNITIAQEAAALFSHMKFTLDPSCVTDKTRFWYRQPDGRCNWLKAGQSTIGSTGYPRGTLLRTGGRRAEKEINMCKCRGVICVIYDR